MKEALDDILNAEKAAAQLVRDARRAAETRRREADSELSKKKADLKEQVRAVIQARVDEEAARQAQNHPDTDDVLFETIATSEGYRHAREMITHALCKPFANGED